MLLRSVIWPLCVRYKYVLVRTVVNLTSCVFHSEVSGSYYEYELLIVRTEISFLETLKYHFICLYSLFIILKNQCIRVSLFLLQEFI